MEQLQQKRMPVLFSPMCLLMPDIKKNLLALQISSISRLMEQPGICTGRRHTKEIMLISCMQNPPKQIGLRMRPIITRLSRR